MNDMSGWMSGWSSGGMWTVGAVGLVLAFVALEFVVGRRRDRKS
jgi:hypothetical protein